MNTVSASLLVSVSVCHVRVKLSKLSTLSILVSASARPNWEIDTVYESSQSWSTRDRGVVSEDYPGDTLSPVLL